MSDRSAVGTRNIGSVSTLQGARDSLENITTALLDDGCFCYVAEVHAHYELHQDSSVPPSPPYVIAPIAGPGRWIPQGFQSSSANITVPTIAARDAIPEGVRFQGMLVFVQLTKCYYSLLSDLLTWTIVANAGLGAQPTWFIDPASGSDSNDGLTLTTALQTEKEWRARCFPFGQQLILKQPNTTLTLVGAAAESFLSFYINIGNVTDAVVTFTIIAQVASTPNILLATSTQTNALTKVRGEITTAAGTFVAKERIRATSGAASGAETYSMGLNGPATDSFTGVWAQSPTLNAVQPAIGDTVVVDTLLWTINRFEANVGALTKLIVQDIKIVRAIVSGSNDQAVYTNGGGNVRFSGCQLLSVDGIWTTNAGGAELLNCRVPATAKIALEGNGWLLINQYVQGVLSVSANGVNIYGLFIDGGNFIVGNNGNFHHTSDGAVAACKVFGISPAFQLGAIEAENGPGVQGAAAAIQVQAGCYLFNDSFNSQMWSAGASGYPLGFLVDGYIQLQADPVLTTTITTFMTIGAANAMKIGNIVFPTYSDTPISLPNSNCGLLVAQTVFLATDNYTYLVGQVSAIGVTTLLQATIASKGTFRFRGYLAVTTVGAAGTLTLNAIFTDDSGTTQTVPVCSTSAAALAGSGGSIEVECNGATAISYSVTGATVGIVYTVRVGVELDSKGCF